MEEQQRHRAVMLLALSASSVTSHPTTVGISPVNSALGAYSQKAEATGANRREMLAIAFPRLAQICSGEKGGGGLGGERVAGVAGEAEQHLQRPLLPFRVIS